MSNSRVSGIMSNRLYRLQHRLHLLFGFFFLPGHALDGVVHGPHVRAHGAVRHCCGGVGRNGGGRVDEVADEVCGFLVRNWTNGLASPVRIHLYILGLFKADATRTC